MSIKKKVTYRSSLVPEKTFYIEKSATPSRCQSQITMINNNLLLKYSLVYCFPSLSFLPCFLFSMEQQPLLKCLQVSTASDIKYEEMTVMRQHISVVYIYHMRDVLHFAKGVRRKKKLPHSLPRDGVMCLGNVTSP